MAFLERFEGFSAAIRSLDSEPGLGRLAGVQLPRHSTRPWTAAPSVLKESPTRVVKRIDDPCDVVERTREGSSTNVTRLYELLIVCCNEAVVVLAFA